MPSGMANDILPKAVWTACSCCLCKLGGTTVMIIVPMSIEDKAAIFLCPKKPRPAYLLVN